MTQRLPANTIWDTRIQSVCGIISARNGSDVEIYLSGNFGQVSLSPPRVVINPNRLYPIEPLIRNTRRFAINVMGMGDRDLVLRLLNMRRRQPRKAEILGVEIRQDDLGIPFLPEALHTIFCEVENVLNTGDHTVMIARVLESRLNPARTGERVLLYPEVSGIPSRFPTVSKIVRSVLIASGAVNFVKKFVYRHYPPQLANIAENTYQAGGQTETEIAEILKFGSLDQNRVLRPPAVAAILKQEIGVCVVGTGWGSFHCQLVRKACPAARLFVCGRDPARTAHLARAVGADDFFLGMEKAVADPRVQALTLALPHNLHRQAVETAAAAGKHVLVEKPIATNLADADAMIGAAMRAGTILMVAEDMHFRPVLWEAARRISNGDIGEPLYLMAFAGGVRRPLGWAADKNQMGGGVLMDIGVHYVRGLRVLFGEPERVFASKAMQINTKISGEDSVQLLFASRVGWEAHMMLSWASTRGHFPDFVLMGDKGTVHLWPGEAFLDYYPVAPGFLMRGISYVRPYWLQKKLLHPQLQRQRIKLRGSEGTGYEREFREFCAAVTENRPPASSGEEGRRDLEIVLCGYEALKSGAWVDIAGHPRAT